jgi:hypothetical protein
MNARLRLARSARSNPSLQLFGMTRLDPRLRDIVQEAGQLDVVSEA